MKTLQVAFFLVVFCTGFTCSSNSSIEINKEKDSVTKKPYKWYEIIEIKKMPFGSSKVTYRISDLKQLNKRNLGENCYRLIIEKWSDGRKKILNTTTLEPILSDNKPDENLPIESLNTKNQITVYPLETYERMIESGVYSSDICGQVADSYFYKNNFVKASKYYDILFKIGRKIQPDFYFRYSKALKEIDQEKKAEEVFMLYEALVKNAKK